ncbi:DUF3105 domain-containing protein [Nocardia sp. NPDC050378]|uniref:DUF3105 domain-containing protein n=1 Tax=Nocardia sp. NPDC050378 TaxID=3155400 RepID=UPI0033E4FA8B
MRVRDRLGVGLMVVAAATACDDTKAGHPLPAMNQFAPTQDNPDPAKAIAGVVTAEFPLGGHVSSTQRVAYTSIPPMGGTHDGVWASCNGVVYPEGIRTENAVHSLEHGAVWIAYNPARVSADDQATLRTKVQGGTYIFMSPIPNMADPLSLQSWGHQLALDSATDPRIDQFIMALRNNPYTTPEPGASCSNPIFDRDPAPYDPSTPGPGSVPMDSDPTFPTEAPELPPEMPAPR